MGIGKKFILGNFTELNKEFYNWYISRKCDILTIKEIDESRGVVIPQEYECEIDIKNILVEKEPQNNVNTYVFTDGKISYFKGKKQTI